MAVIIKNDIEIPKNCDCCHFLYRIEQDDDHPTFYICQLESIGKPITPIPMSSIDIDKRQNWCPLEPVVHGHWMEQKIFTEDSGFKNPIVCSCCGSICVADLYGELFLTNYCPSCGARMDEDG